MSTSRIVGIGAGLQSIIRKPLEILFNVGVFLGTRLWARLRVPFDIVVVLAIKLRATRRTSSNSRLEYRELGENEIRVLALHQPWTKRNDEPIQCTLGHVSLDHTPEYKAWEAQADPQLRLFKKLNAWWKHAIKSRPNPTLWDCRQYNWGDYLALSYMWGSDTPTERIIVNGHFVPVTENLAAALGAAQGDGRIKLGTVGLWVDALCINQNDLLERGKEVRRMKKIYGDSSGVFAHIGPHTEDSELALGLVRKLARKLRDGCDHHLLLLQTAVDEDHPDRKAYTALYRMMSLPYWSRTWIIQELAMGGDEICVHWGNGWVSMHEVRQVLKILVLNVDSFSMMLADEDREKNGSYFQVCIALMWWIGRLWDAAILPTERAGVTYAELRAPILYLGQYSVATDPRDQIYGLLGLFPKELVAKIDRGEQNYTISTRQVFADFAKAVIEFTGELDIIFAGNLNQSTLSKLGLPSWVTDWALPADRSEGRTQEWYFGDDERYKASEDPDKLLRKWTSATRPGRSCGERTSQVRFSNEDKLLHCNGVRIGKVAAFSAELQTPLAISAAPDKVVQLGIDSTVYSDDSDVREALARTLLADPYGHMASRSILFQIPWFGAEADADAASLTIDFGTGSVDMVRVLVKEDWDSRIFGSSFSLLEMFRRRVGLFRVGNRPFKDYFPQEMASCPTSINFEELNIIGANVMGRRLMTTEKGHIGLAPSTVEIGDEIFVLMGCSRPVVLRADPDAEDQQYRVVGDCYVDGFMTGEALEALDDGEYELQEVTLC